MDRVSAQSAVRSSTVNAVLVNLVQRVLVPPGGAAVGDRIVERSEGGEGRFVSFLRGIAQMFVEPAMRGFPCRRVGPSQLLAEPFAHQRMGIERFGVGGLDRRK